LNFVAQLSKSYGDKPVIRSLLQLIPGWGTADTLLQQRANEIRAERMRTFFDELANGQHELTEELIKSEDFLHCYFSTLRAVMNTRQREKIKMMARLLDSSLSDRLTTTDEYEELLTILDAISLREFQTLFLLYNLEKDNPKKEGQNEIQNVGVYWETFKSQVIALGVSEESFPAFMAKMERTGLYLRFTGAFFDYSGDQGQTTRYSAVYWTS
jgi:transketolase